MSEANCQIVSSRGLMKSCDVYPANPVSSIRRCYEYSWSTLKARSTVYVNSSAIPDFIQRALPNITVPFVLVSGDCDETVPYDLFPNKEALQSFLKDSRLIAWFAQNMALLSTKTFQIPIGLDYHTLSATKGHPWGPQQSPAQQEEALLMLRTRKELQQPKAFANFQFSMGTRFGADRKEALATIPKDLVYYPEKSTNRFLTWAMQREYAFVVSPWGGGIDCHRTWEALALGCVPILRSSELDHMFKGLPVLIVTSWSEVTRERLDAFLKEHKSSEELPEKLTLKYWVNKIHLFKGAPVASSPESANE